LGDQRGLTRIEQSMPYDAAQMETEERNNIRRRNVSQV
jgi:hypothetical protein